MKPQIISLVAGAALASCAPQTGLNGAGGASAVSPAALDHPHPREGSQTTGYASAAIGADRYEITYAGPWLGSRDEIEGALLYRAAVLTEQRGSTWFRFLHMPGEAGALSHPSRPAPSFGAAYGHWQPHWTYRTGTSSQPWHPEWGTPFWAETIGGRKVKHVEVHAMIETGRGPLAVTSEADFNVADVLRDLRPLPE